MSSSERVIEDSTDEDDMADAFLSPTSPSFASPLSANDHTQNHGASLSRSQSETGLNGEMTVAPAPATPQQAAQTGPAMLADGERPEPSLLSSVTDLQSWLLNAIPQGRRVLCKIIRRKDGLEKFYPSYEMYIEEPDDTKTFILAARKRKKSKSSNYVITTTRMNSKKKREEDVVAKVRSNFVGTVFTIYDNGRNPNKPKRGGEEDDRPLRQELATVLYEPNILGFKGPRKMTVLMPGMTKTGERIPFAPTEEKDSLYQRYRTGRDREILTLHNKSPQWNEETQSYVLNFNGRVTLASVKNFQIVHDNDLDYILLQFGRIPEDSFTLDFQYPMSAITAFGIALTSFDAKLACE